MAEAEGTGFFTPPGTPDPLRDKRDSGENKKSKKKWFATFLIIFLFLGGLAAGGYFLFQRLLMGNVEPEETTNNADQPPNLSSTNAGEIVTGAEEADIDASLGSAKFTSENFRVGDIAIAGEAEFILVEDTIDPLTVSSIRGDTFSEKNSQDVSLIVSWRTNKLARSEISYSKGAGESRTVREAQYGFTHSLIIPDLDAGATYIYVIRTTDRFGNAVASEPHAVYTGSRETSLFDLIADAVGDIFGWALK